MRRPQMISFADDAEDVVLWRALGGRGDGRYVDGAPSASLTRVFSEAGWSGTLLASDDPISPELASSRPADAVVSRNEAFGTAALPLHLAVLDDAQATPETLAWLGVRPWVVVVRSADGTHGDGLLDGYEQCLDLGRSRFLVASEHASELREALSAPPSSLDGHLRSTEHQLRADLDLALENLMRWRAAGVTRWADVASASPAAAGGASTSNERLAEYARELDAHIRELAAVRSTISWRMTAPLRMASQIARAARSGLRG